MDNVHLGNCNVKRWYDITKGFYMVSGLGILQMPIVLLYETINKYTARRVKFPDGVFSMMTAVQGIYGG